jgi:hypothetical protein
MTLNENGQSRVVRMTRVDDLDPTKLTETLSATTTPSSFFSSLEQLEREAGTDKIPVDENGGA